ncbi:MAG: U32 family peptidase [Verrucomicrobiae bacterium]|nr:U32 family peptidase [Verrucomicrobiae bacterium]
MKPELLAPAGNWDCLRAAVANGADAVYFGLSRFNARLRADNFTEKDIGKIVSFLHAHQVKAYVAFNTLIFTSELEEAAKQLILLEDANVDAVIVQDIGLARLAQQLTPKLAVHASTQMTITSPESAAFIEKLGVKQIVLGREVSLRELEKFRDQIKVPLEVFVHGALCVAYSGQCLTSEALGQRSANRGECAQACRLPYQLIVDGVLKELGDRRYLLSPQDLMAVQEIPQLIRLGVKSFKIEGRLKSPEYVAAITQVYRKAIDGAVEHLSPEDRYRLEMVFSRGLFSGWMHGVNHQKLVHGRYGKKRGVLLGKVVRIGKDWLELERLLAPAKAGDGVVFEDLKDLENEAGGRIYRVEGMRLFFSPQHVYLNQLKIGTWVCKTDDPQLNRELERTYRDLDIESKTSLDFSVSGKISEPLGVKVKSEVGEVEIKSKIKLQLAEKQPLTKEVLQQNLGRLGGTCFQLRSLHCDLESSVILPLSELNRMRRLLVEQLNKEKTKFQEQKKNKHEMKVQHLDFQQIFPFHQTPASQSSTVHLTVLCRNQEQMETAWGLGVSRIYLDFEDVKRYRDAIAWARQQNCHTETRIFLATPRIQKAGEEGIFRLVERAEPDGVLIRNLGGVHYFRESSLEKIGDFSLNVTNPITAHYFIKQRLRHVTLSYDLNESQALDLLQKAPADWFEITLHQHMPLFHMEHCVFAAFLSSGTDHTNCGRPCDRHAVRLRDRVGMEHPVVADVGCRNTMFHAKAQSGAIFFKEFIKAGARDFRIELLRETSEQTQRVIETYLALVHSKLSSVDLVKKLKVVQQLGVTHLT